MEENQTIIEAFLKHKQQNTKSKRENGISENSLHVYALALGTLSKDIDKPFKEATQEDILKHLEKYKQKTKNFKISLYHELYRFLFNLEDTDTLPDCIRKIKSRNFEIDEVKYREKLVTPEEYNLLLETCERPIHKAILEALWCFGSRKAGIQSLLVKDVSFDGVFTKLTIREDKTQPRDVVYKGRCEHLLKWVESLCPNKDTPDSPLFVTCIHGQYKPIADDYINGMLERLTERAGIKKHVRPHDVRHTVATRLLQEGTPTTHVCSQMGWKKNTAMLKIYDHNGSQEYQNYLLTSSQTNAKPTYELLLTQKKELQTVHETQIQLLNERLKLSEETQKRTEQNITQIIESLQVYQPELSELVRKKAVGAAQTVLKNPEKH